MADATRPDDSEPTPEQQPAVPSADRWGDPITPERADELKALADQQRTWVAAPDHQGRDSYFRGVQLTGAEVFWLAAYALAGPDGDLATTQERLRHAREGLIFQGYTLGPVQVVRPVGPDLVTALHLEGTVLWEAHLEGAFLAGVHLEGADLWEAHLEGADLWEAHVEGVHFNRAHLEGANLARAHLEEASLWEAYVEGADLAGTQLVRAGLGRTHLEGANLFLAHLEGAGLWEAHLEGANLGGAHLEGAALTRAYLEGKTYAPGDADLARIRQWAPAFPTTLPPADLRRVFLSTATTLDNIRLGSANGGTIQVADVRWGGVNLAVVNWTPFTDKKAVLGDEQAARDWQPEQYAEPEWLRKGPRRKRAEARAAHAAQQDQERLQRFQAAVRANRQLATVLRDQGMNEEADHFVYRAQVLQRRVFQLQGKRIRAGFSRFLDLLAGHGYKPERSVYVYLLVIFGFALGYWLVGPSAGHTFHPDAALVFSVTSFHGRGFFPGGLDLENWITRLAALEAVIGLLIEVSFIATFTQRFFGSK